MSLQETRCSVCGRRIRKSPWVERGIGPECYAALRRGAAEAEQEAEAEQAQLEAEDIPRVREGEE